MQFLTRPQTGKQHTLIQPNANNDQMISAGNSSCDESLSLKIMQETLWLLNDSFLNVIKNFLSFALEVLILIGF